MGILDFDAVFDILDPACRGYMTVDQIREFDTTLHFTPLIKPQVEAAIRQICGVKSAGRVNKVHFMKVLEELERRRIQEDKVRWDFAALDQTGDNLITVKDALLLFKLTLGDEFSLQLWNAFLASRVDPLADLCFDDVRLLLCDLPADGAVCSPQEMLDEEMRLEKEKEDKLRDESEALQKRQEGDVYDMKRKNDHEERTKRLAKRKLMRWDEGGVECFIEDDGRESGECVRKKARQTIGINDLLDILDAKYNTIRKKLFWQMLRMETGDIIWTSMSDGDQIEAFQQLQMEEKLARKDGSLAAKANELRGGNITHNATLSGMMGDVAGTEQKTKDKLQERRLQLKVEMKSCDEIDNILRQEYIDMAMVPTTFGDLLIALQQRYDDEKSSVLGLVNSGTTSRRHNHISDYYCSVTRQLELTTFEEAFAMATIAVGLAERKQEYRSERFTLDRLRQENLAALRLAEKKLPTEQNDDASTSSSVQGSDETATELRSGIIHQLLLKHEAERDMMKGMLQGREAKASKTVAKQLTPEHRSNRLTLLRNQRTRWRDNSLVYRSSHKKLHHTMLQEGTGLYYEDVRLTLLTKGRGNVSEDDINACVMADLQLMQDEEMQGQLPLLINKDQSELADLKTSTQLLRMEGVMDNVAGVLLGTYLLKEMEIPFNKALEKKYDCMRHLVLLHELKLEHMTAWDRLTEGDQMRLLMKRKQEETQLRQDGKLDEMSQLIPNTHKEVATLRELVGEDRAEFARQEASLYEKQQHQAYMGQDFTKTQIDELPASEVRSTNILADLVQRFYAEQDHLISQLRSMGADASEQVKELPLVLLRLEIQHLKLDEWFDIGALGLGLMERVKETVKGRHPADKRRQVQLAKLRLKARKDRLDSGSTYQKLDDGKVPEKGHLLQWMQAYVKEMAKKHIEEREQLLSILQDPSFIELCEVAKVMSDDDKKKRLLELLDKQQKLNLQNSGEREQNFSILEEVAAIRCTLEMTPGGDSSLDDELVVGLQVELQDEQDHELAAAIAQLTELPEEDLKIVREYQMEARHWEACTNILNSLARYRGSVKEEDLMEALEEKYDALRDKLLMEALIAQLGETEWRLLSEQERQRRLMQLKLEERRLRQEGKLDEINKLLGEGAVNQERLQQLLGDSKEDAERRLKERLALRKKRLAEGMSEAECDKLEEEEEEEDRKRRNVLLNLQTCFDDEKAALLRSLEGQKNHIEAERLRQLELAKLKRDKRRTKEEDKFESAARLLNLSKEQGEAYEASRKRQEDLAREHLQARLKARQKRSANQILDGEDTIVPLPENDDDVTLLQDAVMKEVELKHQQERELLMALFPDPDVATHRKKASQLGSEERDDRHEELRLARDQWKESGAEDPHQQLHILKEATGLEMEILGQQFANDGKDSSDESLQVALLADLQQRQDSEAQRVLNDLVEKTSTVLKETKSQHASARDRKFYDNVAAVVLAMDDVAPPAGDDEMLVDELQKKYDALKDKLLLEALMKQSGEAEWAALSERERQARLLKLKREEKRLRREGKMDEAAALLGSLKDQEEALAQLLGDTRTDAKRRLEERLQRRQELLKEREAKGLSTEEAILDALQDEEEEENKKKRRRNILEELDNHFDDEKAALLAALRNHDNQMDAERQRQLEMAKLKRQRKQLQMVEKFDSAALLMQEVKEQGEFWENKLSSEKERQLALARERVAARRQKRAAAVSGEQLAEQLAEDSKNAAKRDDGATVQEALLDVMEKKQTHERDTLLDLIVAASGDAECQQHADGVAVEEVMAVLQNLHSELETWKSEVCQQIAPPEGHEMTPDEKDEYFVQVAKSRAELFNHLKKAVALRVKAEKTVIATAHPEWEEKELVDETTVQLLARLQQHQTAENSALYTLMTDFEKEALERLLEAERTAATEAWLDNVVTTVYTDTPLEVPPEGDTVAEFGNTDSLKEELEKELENEKQELLERNKNLPPGDQIDIEGEMARLEAQQEARRKALDAVLQRQQQKLQARLDAKRLKQDSQQYEQQAASQMMRMAKLNEARVEELKAGERGHQQELMQEKLALRREARRHRAEETQQGEELRRDSSGILSPGGLLKREKTVVDVNLSDSMKEEVFQQLIAQQTTLNKKISSEQKRREEQLKERLARMKKRRSYEALDVLETAEKQRTSLEKAVKDERDRSISKTKERVERLRYEKTMTMMQKGDKSAKKFDELVSEKDPGLTDDERMQLAAKQLQSRFKQEELKTSVLLPIPESPLPDMNIQPEQADDAMKKLKEKRKQKKKQKQQQEETE